MHKRITSAFVIALTLVALAAGAVLALDQSIARWSIGGGGGGRSSVGVFAIEDSLGQALSGTDASVPIQLCIGVRCGAAAERVSLYLPVMRR